MPESSPTPASKTHSTADRNLLIGILALQLEIVSRDQLVSAFQHWLVDRTRPIQDILAAQNHLNVQQRVFVESLAEKYLELFSGDVVQSIAALSSATGVKSKLGELEDPELDATLSAARTVPADGTRDALDSTLSFTLADENERFRILRPHARGGLGQVSVAEDRDLHREVALKEIQPQFSKDRFSRSRFLLEAEITGRLEHPGIVPVYSLGASSDGQPFYVMRFIHGDSMKQAVSDLHAQRASMKPHEFHTALRKLLRRFIDVCNAIEYAHSRGVLHRDLKPGNIMLGKYGETLVVDWGLAKTIGRSEHNRDTDEATLVPESADGSTATRLGSLVGTTAYMSPEQAAGKHDQLNAASDVYCLGGTLYSLLTGRTPIGRGEQAEMLEKIRRGDIVPAHQINPLVPRALEAVCSKAMSLRSEERYATAAELGEEIERWLADEPVAAYPDPFSIRAVRWARRHRAAVASISAVALLTIIGLSVFSSIISRKNVELSAARELESAQRKELSRLALAQLNSAEKDLANVPGSETYRTKMMDEAYKKLQILQAAGNVTDEEQEAFAIAARLSGNQNARALRFDEGLKRLHESIATQEHLSARSESWIKTIYLADTHRDLADHLRFQGRLRDAVKELEIGKAMLLVLKPKPQEKAAVERSLAMNLYSRAGMHFEKAEFADAADCAEQSYNVLKNHIDLNQPTAVDSSISILAGNLAARAMTRNHELDRAHLQYADVLKWIETVSPRNSKNRDVQFATAVALYNSADANLQGREVDLQMQKSIDDALALLSDLQVYSSETYRMHLALAWSVKGKMLQAAGDANMAKEAFEQARQISAKSLESSEPLKRAADVMFRSAMIYRDYADFESAQGNMTAAQDWNDQCRKILAQLQEVYPEVTMYKYEADATN
ncbi:MAG: serine/threonine-protein kinase [Pirellulales bacterium]